MKIANPIYDVVFKYIMNDNKMAKFVLSKLLERKIVKLEYNPKDIQFKKDELIELEKNEIDISVCYMDFAATVLDKNGKEEIIIIELQKSRFHTDITRFRTYLGSTYINKNGEFEITLKNGSVIRTARHIQSIYILGHRLENSEYSKYVALKYSGKMEDAFTHKPVKISEDPFVDALNHDSLYIQIPNIKKKIKKRGRKKGLESIINLFNQKDKKRNKHHIEINPDNYPKEFKGLIKLLTKAGASPNIEDLMNKEDFILDELERVRNRNTTLEKKIEHKDKELENKDKELEDRDKSHKKQLFSIAKSLLDILNNEQIAEKTGLSINEIEKLRKEVNND